MRTNSLAPREVVHLSDIKPLPGFLTRWEAMRHKHLHWFVECFAEFLGVFLYVYAGVGSTAGFVIGNILKEEGLSSIFQVGLAYSFGILMAIAVCAGTSGGHFSPGVTIMCVLYRRFPSGKAIKYIIAQIFGAFIACLIVYVQYQHAIHGIEKAMLAKKIPLAFTPQTTPGILALYVLPGSNLGQVFLNEFMSSFLLGLVIWACLDPGNFLIPPASGPFVIAFAYGAIIWGYAPVGVSLNTARDVGGRLAAMAIYGTKANGGAYSAIAALGNIPAMLLAGAVYELFLADSDRVVASHHLEFLYFHKYHAKKEEDDRLGASAALRNRADSLSVEQNKAMIEHRSPLV